MSGPPRSARSPPARGAASIGSSFTIRRPRWTRSRDSLACLRGRRDGARKTLQPIRRRTRVKCLHAGWLASLPETLRGEVVRSLNPDQAFSILYDWRFWARPNQLPPAGDWRVWLLLAGRGFGKTRTGAELVRSRAASGAARRIAFVAPTAADAREVMVEGESGILTISPPRECPRYEASKRRLTWPNGTIATLFSADEPERLRGPQHDLAWCDELAAWRYPEAWDMLMFGLRLGQDPRAIVTTTPRPAPLVRMLLADPMVVVTRGRTAEN